MSSITETSPHLPVFRTEQMVLVDSDPATWATNRVEIPVGHGPDFITAHAVHTLVHLDRADARTAQVVNVRSEGVGFLEVTGSIVVLDGDTPTGFEYPVLPCTYLVSTKSLDGRVVRVEIGAQGPHFGPDGTLIQAGP